jgi:hypothetical protein
MINDPARTAATVGAKLGDDVVATLGNFAYVEIPIPTTPGACEIVVRQRVEKQMKRDEKGDPVRDADKNVVYEEVEVESRTLRLRAFTYVIGRTESETPHSTFRVVNLDKDPNPPMALWGDVVAEAKIDLGYGTEPTP